MLGKQFYEYPWDIHRATGLAVVVGICLWMGMAVGAQAADRTVEVTPAKADEGRALVAVCAGCHGFDLEGKVGVGPRLNSSSFLAAASDAFLAKTISEGRLGTTMISWKAVYTPTQIESIIAYLRSVNPVEPVELNESPNKGDAKDGGEWFQRICSTCHGRNGAGYMELGSGTGIGRKAFLDNVSNGYLRYITKHGKDLTMMRPFDEKNPASVANLSDGEIENIIAFLRASAW